MTSLPPFSPTNELKTPLPATLYLEDKARAAGYQVLAGPYTTPQRWMAQRILSDLATDPDIAVCLVKKSRGIEVWIQPSPRQAAITRKLMPPILHSYLRPVKANPTAVNPGQQCEPKHLSV
jgi:hypothetical protein